MFHAIIGICTGRNDAVNRAVPVDEDDRSDVRAYLETMVGKGDTVALLAVSRWKSAAVVQEIQRVEDLARPESVRRLQLDLDEGGREGLARLRRDVDAGVVPTPAVIRQSSRDRYQVLWNTREGAWTPAGAEGTMTRLAGRYGGDYAVADVARVMRMPGLQNQKPGRESWHVTWGRYGSREVVPDDFGRVQEVEQRREPRRAAKRETVTEWKLGVVHPPLTAYHFARS